MKKKAAKAKAAKPESAKSQMKRLDHAIESKEAEIVNDGLKAIVKSEQKPQTKQK